MHTYKKGDSVIVINQTLSGRFIVEGRAKVLRTLRDIDEMYLVSFWGAGEQVQRFIDPQAQKDPDAFVRQLNEQAASGCCRSNPCEHPGVGPCDMPAQSTGGL